MDGFIAHSNDELWSWFPWDGEMQSFANDFFLSKDAWMFGRNTYEAIVPYWLSMADGKYFPGAPPPTETDLAFAKWVTNAEKIVVTTTLDDEGDRTVVNGDVADAVAKIKQQAGGDIVLSCGPSLVAVLTKSQLIDEYVLNVCPVVIGSGKQLFSELTEELPLRLISARKFESGFVSQSYEPNY